MAAPTVVFAKATQASSTTTTGTITGPAAGDLAVLLAVGTQTAIPNSTIDRNGTTDTGWSLDNSTGVDGSGTTRTRIWSKVLDSSDFSSGSMLAVGPTGWTNNGTSRIVLFVFRHADGFDTTAANRKVNHANHNTNVTNGSSVASISGGVRKLVAVTGVSFAAAQSALTVTWDTGSAQDPYVDESSSTTSSGASGSHFGTSNGQTQADFKTYDTAETVDLTYSAGLNNTTHAIGTVVYKTKPPTQTVAVGTASETDTGTAISHTRARTIGVATETDTASPIVRRVVGTINTALETDTANPIGHYKTRAVGTALETDTASSIGHGKLVAVGTATTDEAGLPVTWTKSTTAVISLSTPGAAAYATRILRAWAYTAAATDVAELQLVLLQGSTPVSASAWLPLTSTPTAYALTVTGSISDYSNLRVQVTTRTTSSAVVRVSQIELELTSEIGTAAETDTASSIGHKRARTIGVATETDTASPIRPTKQVAVGTAVETDTARPVTVLVARDLTMTYGALVKKWSATAPTQRWSFQSPEV